MRWKRNSRKKTFRVSFYKIIFPVLLLFSVLSIIAIIRSNIFILNSVDVHLDKVACTDSTLIKSSSNLLGQNFFLINTAKVESNLKKKFICIKEVKTQKQFPDKIKLTVSGREPAAILIAENGIEASESGLLERFTESQASESAEATSSAIFISGGKNLLVDNEGIIYSSNTEGVNATRIYASGLNLTIGQSQAEELIKNALKILEKVKSFGVNITDSKIYPEKLLLVNAMPRIIFRLDDKQEIQIASLQLILNKAKINRGTVPTGVGIDDSNLEFIDLRFDKPVVRFAPKKR